MTENLMREAYFASMREFIDAVNRGALLTHWHPILGFI